MNAYWIAEQGVCLSDWRKPAVPAPFFRREFECPFRGKVLVRICGLGYYELHLNGAKVGDRVLDPVVSVYDKRVRYVTYDVTETIREGVNAIGVILGNGWYNSHTPEVWHFDKASWRDYPKVFAEITLDGAPILGTDDEWKCSSGPIVFDGLRNGETYDARLELTGWDEPGFDDSHWRSAARVAGPGGALEAQTQPPCKVMQTLAPVNTWVLDDGDRVYDFGQNMTGWVRLVVSALRGTEVTLRYAEKLDGKDIDQRNIASFILTGDCQTDRYILKGGGEECWEPRFTYHGFQYVRVSGAVDVHRIEGRVVHTAFSRIGEWSCSDPEIDRLYRNTVWSYIGNFVGIPTDCPHREKNGWTGDAQLAAETGLYNFAAGSAYAQWLETLADTQRPDGSLPGIAPSSGWGFNWGNGPAWDSALVLIPWHIYLYTGDSGAIRDRYEDIRRYVDYLGARAKRHIVSFGLGDWCPVVEAHAPDPALTSTAYYYVDALTLSSFARITGREEDRARYAALAEAIRRAFNDTFYRGDGVYGAGEMTSLGCALYQGLVDESERAAVVRRLVESVEGNGRRPDFGILGAKYVPRALAENGHVDLAYQMIAQPEFPGWVYWQKQGATTLWETWRGDASRNHIMFGDVAAWMFKYLAGISPDSRSPGFRHVRLSPHGVAGLDWVRAHVDTPQGRVSSAWSIEDGAFVWEGETPSGVTVDLVLPGSELRRLTPGVHRCVVAALPRKS